jgi:hypothetical protein
VHLALQSVTDENGMAVLGLDAAIRTEDGALLHPGGHFDFTVMDEDFANIDTSLGITHAEAVGKEIVHLSGSEEGALHIGHEADHERGQVIVGTENHDTIYVSQGNDILVGGPGPGTFVWNNLNMGQGDHALDIIKDFAKGDALHFEDLMAASDDGQETALNYLLSGENATWRAHEESVGGIFHATDDQGTSIQLNIAEAIATLTVSYQHEGQNYMQNVELQNFDAAEFHQDALDQTAVAEMLKEIIQVGGST